MPLRPRTRDGTLARRRDECRSYRLARLRGLSVDQPRNLAKTVTVE